MLTTAATAARLGVSRGRVLQLIRAGRLPARKLGRDWTVREKDLHLVAVRRPGRPVTTGAGLRRRDRQPQPSPRR